MKPTRKPEKLGGILEGLLSEKGLRSVAREYEVVRKWSDIVGERVSHVTECTHVENGVLYVRVASSAWRQEIAYLKHTILSKSREVTNCTSLTDIVFY
jgi:predicted nucleic acid-binding Zn ribbon protein